ncbi:MAG: hypothetical protein ACYTFG_07135 [Planctomycetota bacterium]|jgi:quinol-cytochrome oxidoreductase complex cytochrome b subunit
MILLLKTGITVEEADGLAEAIRSRGAEAVSTMTGDRILLKVTGSPTDIPDISALGLVEAVLPEPRPEDGTTPVWPDVFLSHGAVACAILSVLILLAAFLPPGLAEQADPLSPPEEVRPGWYFAAMFRILKLFPASLDFLGVVCILAILVAVLFLPFIDRSTSPQFLKRPLAWVGLALGMFMVIMTLIGVFS